MGSASPLHSDHYQAPTVNLSVHSSTQAPITSYAWPAFTSAALSFFGEGVKVICPAGDVFIDAPHQAEQRQQLWSQYSINPSRVYLLLTRHPENVMRMLPPQPVWRKGNQLPENVLIGCLIDSQAAAEKLIPELLRIPVRHFLYHSALLSPIPYLLNGTYRHTEEGCDLQQCTGCGAGVWEDATSCSNCRCTETDEWTPAEMFELIMMPDPVRSGSELQVSWLDKLQDDYTRAEIPIIRNADPT